MNIVSTTDYRPTSYSLFSVISTMHQVGRRKTEGTRSDMVYKILFRVPLTVRGRCNQAFFFLHEANPWRERARKRKRGERVCDVGSSPSSSRTELLLQEAGVCSPHFDHAGDTNWMLKSHEAGCLRLHPEL